jgi:uncharacterized protein (DUF1684 family)
MIRTIHKPPPCFQPITRTKINFAFIFLLLVAGVAAIAQGTTAYQKEVDNWHRQRIQNLKADDGWLNLAGLFWLKDGINSFGTAKTNAVIFPAGTINGQAGYFEKTGNTVKVVAAKGASIKVNGKPVKEAVIFSSDFSKPAVVSCGNLQWTIIKRENKIGVRLRNLKSDQLAHFTGVQRFPVDPAWKVEATLVNENHPADISITNVLGQTSPQKSPGKLVFSINGKQYSLDALDEDGKLFILFADATSGKTTYTTGRFLSADNPGPGGKTVLDFNKAYNPPCAFTPYATCPLPPAQNVLAVAVTAGEKKYGNH